MNLFIVAAALLHAQSSWPVGVEREVDEGTYMQVAAQEQGWRVWRIETRTGVRCLAFKSARGRRHPAPVGVNSMMDRVGTPFLEVFWEPTLSRFYAEWGAAHYGRVRAKYRIPGARFWEEGDPDPSFVQEVPYEVTLESWEYPEILVGHVEQEEVIDLTGLAWAKAEIATCEGFTPPDGSPARRLDPVSGRELATDAEAEAVKERLQNFQAGPAPE